MPAQAMFAIHSEHPPKRTVSGVPPAAWRWLAMRASILVLVMAASSLAAESPRALRWAADSEGGAPYIFKDPEDPNRLVGFEVDLARALEVELGRRIEFVQYQFSQLVPGLKRGDFDFAMNGLEVTPDRARAVRFTRPYYVYSLQLVARAEESRFGGLEGCRAAGGTVGTLEDTAAERLLDAWGIRKRVYDSQVEPYVDLESGRIDAVLLDLPIAMYYAQAQAEAQVRRGTVGARLLRRGLPAGSGRGLAGVGRGVGKACGERGAAADLREVGHLERGPGGVGGAARRGRDVGGCAGPMDAAGLSSASARRARR